MYRLSKNGYQYRVTQEKLSRNKNLQFWGGNEGDGGIIAMETKF